MADNALSNLTLLSSIASTDLLYVVRSGNSRRVLVGSNLALLAALSGTDTLYYRDGSGLWTPVTISSPLSFTGGALGVSNASIADAKLVTMAAYTLKGNNSGSSAVPGDISIAS